MSGKDSRPASGEFSATTHHLTTSPPHHPTTSQIVLWPFVLSRVWVALFVYLGHVQHPYLSHVAGGWEGVKNWWLNPWTLFDSHWFLRIAAAGYEPQTTPFFPLYPFLLRLAGPNEVALAAWGVLLSNLAFAIGLFYLYHLTALDYDERVARLAVWLLAFFPTSAISSAVYSESLFFALLTGTFYCVRRDRWAWAGLWSFLASLTRNSGPLIFLALVLEWLRYKRARERPVNATAMIAVWLPLLGFVAVQVYLKMQAGEALPAVSRQGDFSRIFTWPWNPILWDAWNVITLQHLDLVTLLNLAATLAVFVLVIRHWKRQRPAYSLLLIGIMLMQLTYGRLNPPHTNSSLRYLSTTFPFVQLVAIHCRTLLSNRFRMLLVGLAYLLICALMSFLFGLKWFAAG